MSGIVGGLRFVRCVAMAASLCGAATVRAQVPGELVGRITDAATARPLTSARIELTPHGDVARADADGAFVLRGLEPGAYHVRVRAIGYRTRELDATIANGRQRALDVALEPLLTQLATVAVRDTLRDLKATGITTLNRAAIESTGRRDLGELLQMVPGVVITQTGGAGAGSKVSLRGSEAYQVLVLVDGVPVNSAISGDVDLSLISLEGVERVTVRMGAQSARYGARAMAGVIDIETRHVLNEASTVLRSGAFGERGAAATAGASRDIGNKRAGGSLTAEYRTVRGNFEYDVPAVRGGGRATRDNADATSCQLLGNTSLDGTNAGVTFRGSLQDMTRGLVGSVVQPSLTGRQRRTSWLGVMDAHWRRDALSLSGIADVNGEHASYVDPSPPFVIPFDERVRASGTSLATTAAYDRNHLSASVGGELRSLSVTSSALSAEAPHAQRLLGAFGTFRMDRPLADDRLHVDAEASARIDNEPLTHGSVISPRVVLRLVHARVAASASLGSGYAPPSLADQFFHEGVQARNNPTLRPERTQHDLEARLSLRESAMGPLRVSSEGAVFRANVDGMILWMPDYRFIWSPSNFDVRRSGWELRTHALMPKAWLDASGSISRVDIAYTGPVLNGQVAYRPRTTAVVNFGVAPRRARVDLISSYVGARRTIAGSPLNALTAYWRHDVKVSASRSSRAWTYDASLGVDNVLDQPAAMLVDYPFPGRAWSVSMRVKHASR